MGRVLTMKCAQEAGRDGIQRPVSQSSFDDAVTKHLAESLVRDRYYQVLSEFWVPGRLVCCGFSFCLTVLTQGRDHSVGKKEWCFFAETVTGLRRIRTCASSHLAFLPPAPIPPSTMLSALTWSQKDRLKEASGLFSFCFPQQNYSVVQNSYFKSHESALCNERFQPSGAVSVKTFCRM